MKKVLAGNWKMYKTRAEVRDFFAGIGAKLAGSEVLKIVAPSATLLETAVEAAKNSGIEIFSQNCAWEDMGAFTGETSPLQLKDLGVVGTLVGHSERRQYFAETDATCLKRAAKALHHGLKVIYCIGETLDERKSGQTQNVLKRQLAPVLDLKASGAELFVAYEPVWAIGTGVVAEVAQVKEAHGWIVDLLKQGQLEYCVLYGGSVKPANFKELATISTVSGGLVGGASLEIQSFLSLHQALQSVA